MGHLRSLGDSKLKFDKRNRLSIPKILKGTIHAPKEIWWKKSEVTFLAAAAELAEFRKITIQEKTQYLMNALYI